MADFSDDFFFNNFNTELPPEQESSFQDWMKRASLATGHDKTLDLNNYDLRGAFAAGKITPSDINGHLTDEFKKPNHPTFSDESMYHDTPSPLGVPYQGGQWTKFGPGPRDWQFKPSPFMLQYTMPRESLETYFRTREKDARLLLPK